MIDEIVEFNVEDEFVLVLPANTHREASVIQSARADIRKELVEAVVASNPSRQKMTSRREAAHNHLIDNHGIPRNDSIYIELQCSVASYPNRHIYTAESCSLSEVKKHIRGNAGLNVRLLDYPLKTPLLKWKDMHAIQIFVPHFRGDCRPRVGLSNEYQSPLYGEELDQQFRQVKDDHLQTVELRLVNEQKKSAHLESKVTQLSNISRRNMLEDQQLATSYFKKALEDEMKSDRLTIFSEAIDNIYRKSWIDHYSTFQSRVRLLPQNTALWIYDGIEKMFPYHFMSLKTTIFGQRAHEPARAKLPGYTEKKKKLSHHFMGMIRERNPRLFVYWAMVGTVALYYKGVCMKYVRTNLWKPYTTMLQTAFEKLDAIYEATLPTRLALLRLLQIGCHSSDNYQQYHPYSTQRCGAPGVYHNGMVFNFVMAKEFTKPRGTVIEHLLTKHRWVVIESRMINFWCGEVVLKRTIAGDADAHQPDSSFERMVVNLPHLEWKIISMPGESSPVDITYIDQDVPPSLHQNIPPNLDDASFVLGARTWMDPKAPPLGTDSVKLPPRKFVHLLHDCERIKELFDFDPTFDNNTTPRYECLPVFKSKLTNLLKKEPSMYDAADTFRIDCLRYWNEAYDATDKFMWFPITPHDEMKKDEAMLAMVQIFVDLGLIEENEQHEFSLCPGAEKRYIFQYGDVLTIQKWYQLAIVILHKMTHIGKEEYVEMMMTVYNNFIKCQDYLHENIHRLQFIFTIYYGGFIQACQVVLGTKRIRQDPTKGKWRDAELLTMKIYWALRRIRLEEFLQQFMEGNSNLLDADTTNPRDVVWKLEKEYESYCESLERCSCQKSRAAALFMKYTQEWLLCRDGVPLGDWATLEVQGHDWLTGWFCVKKPQYREETQRRIEKMYALPFWLLEYLRMSRFVRMTDGKRFISLNDFCEKHNLAQKLSTKNKDFEDVCKRSRHLSAAQRCALELFGDKSKDSKRMCINDDVRALYDFFRKVDVFTTPNEEFKVTEMTFWCHVVPADFSETDEKKKHDQRKTIGLTQAKKGVISTFFDVLRSTDDSDGSEPDDEESSDDDCSVDSNRTAHSDMSILSDLFSSDNSEQRPETINFATVAAQEEALKRLGNVGRCKMNMLLIVDLFAEGRKKMEKARIVLERKRAQHEEELNIRMIYDCVASFKAKMSKILSFMQAREESLPEHIGRELEDWEQAYIDELNIDD